VAAGTVADPQARSTHEIDVVVSGRDGDDRPAVLGIGEAKWSGVAGVRHLQRLATVRDVLRGRGQPAGRCRLMLFSGAGFTDELQEIAAADPDVQLIGLNRLYGYP